MQIIIPMSGTGQRFIDAGYRDIKPLILIDEKPIIEHVVKLFPGEADFVFICNQDHLKATPLRQVLEKLAPAGQIVAIAPHKKGPVFAVDQIVELIRDKDEVIVNYCDFGKSWDYRKFLEHTRRRQADGAVSAYRGFHPHMLGTTNYAFMRDEQQWMKEIREKEPFTNDRTQEFASDGTYYFRSGALVKRYFRQLLEQGPDLNGEYYISLVYKHMLADGLKISIYEIQHMLQWGEPKDLEEYRQWSDMFRRLSELKRRATLTQPGSINLIPLAGRGKRFTDAGYTDPKPLVEVSGRPMIVQAVRSLPPAEKQVFICLNDHLKQFPLAKAIKAEFRSATIMGLNQVTEGQACTCELGLKDADPDAPLMIGACDNGMIWDQNKYQALLDDMSVDCIVWSFRRHMCSLRNPQMYGWIKVDDQDKVFNVSVKVPISDDPFNDHAIIGAFYFRQARYFLGALKELYTKNIRVNNEFYVDSLINEIVEMGLVAKVFPVDHYVCWGTPNDLKTYEYWQSFFHKCPWHPYNLIRDPWMNLEKADVYDLRSREFRQEY